MSGSASGAPGAASLSYGRSTTIVIVHPLAVGGRLDVPNVTGFSARQNVVKIDSKWLDGTHHFRDLPSGWTGEFDVDRGNSVLDDWTALCEQQWYAFGTIATGTVYEYVAESDGSVSTYQYSGATFDFDAGRRQGDSLVKQKLTFRASKRVKV